MRIVTHWVTIGKCFATQMALCPPFSLRLTREQIQWLDRWSGDEMSRGTAIRLLIHEAMKLHRDGILPTIK